MELESTVGSKRSRTRWSAWLALAVAAASCRARESVGSPAAPTPVPIVEAIAPANDAPRTRVQFRFVEPNGEGVELERASVELVARDRAPLRLAVDHAWRFVADDLELLDYVVRIKTDGFVHREQTLHLAQYGDATSVELLTNMGWCEDLLVWPDDALAVIVETPDGRPFGELAAELAPNLAIDPENLFVEAFDARIALLAPAADAWPAEQDETLASFHRPLGHQAWEMPGHAVGWFELKHALPLHVGLSLFGTPLGFELAKSGAHEVVFRLDGRELEKRLARLSVRFIDADSHPLTGVRPSLIADAPANRRDELSSLAPNADGVFVALHLVPGRYVLSVAHGDAVERRELELAVGEARDLGAIVLTDTLRQHR